MPKAPRHRKRTRTARIESTAAPTNPSNPASTSTSANGTAATPSPFATGSNGHQAHTKKVGKKEAEVTNLLDKLRSSKVEERVWASSALSSLLLSLPPVTLRLLLSKNLIGLLIERLSDAEDEVVVECLGALRNLAVSSPPSILSEMHNKRLLLPLLTLHLPLLRSLLPSMLLPPSAPVVAPLPSTAADREAADALNEHAEKRRRLYWDWCENVLTLLWCAAESNTKILASLNTAGNDLVEFLMAFLDVKGLGLDVNETGDGMDVEGALKKKGKKVKKDTLRVPLFVAVTAAQTLHALISSNPPANALAVASPLFASLATILSTSTPPSSQPTRTDTHHRPTPESEAEDYLALRVLCFGVILEAATTQGGKGRAAKAMKEEMMQVLKQEQGCLLHGLKTDLNVVVQASIVAANEMGATSSEAPEATPTGPSLRLANHEKNLSSLQLSLEILSGWCATLDASGLAGLAGEEEEWGGIAGDDDMEDDIEMGDDDEDSMMGGAQERHDQEEEGDDDEEGGMGLEDLSTEALQLVSSLPQLLLALALPTPISFVKPAAISSTSTPDLIPTAITTSGVAPSTDLPLPLVGIADIVTTIHVRALECLNNLYITLARSSSSSDSSFLDDAKNVAILQKVWESTLGLILTSSTNAPTSTSTTAEKKEEDGEERQMEMMMAGVGAIWGMARVGLGESSQLMIGAATTPFLISIFTHPFALSATPASEAIRVRILGSLGWIGRRETISVEENQLIGSFLLSILPNGKENSVLLPTPEVLLQAIDSLIDIYSDENSTYDGPVFIAQSYLARIEASIIGVRSAVKKVDKKKFPELRTRADGALANLIGFLEYRRSIV